MGYPQETTSPEALVAEALQSIREMIQKNLDQQKFEITAAVKTDLKSAGLDEEPTSLNTLSPLKLGPDQELPVSLTKVVDKSNVLLLTRFFEGEESKPKFPESRTRNVIQKIEPVLTLKKALEPNPQIVRPFSNEFKETKGVNRNPPVEERGESQGGVSGSLVSKETQAALETAFDILASIVSQTQDPLGKTPSETLKNNAKIVLETLNNDLLRSLLKEWLDAHLPALVKSLVTEEIEKIVSPLHSKT